MASDRWRPARAEPYRIRQMMQTARPFGLRRLRSTPPCQHCKPWRQAGTSPSASGNAASATSSDRTLQRKFRHLLRPPREIHRQLAEDLLEPAVDERSDRESLPAPPPTE